MHCDVVVVGLGHAGCEAALACARLGLHTVALTQRLDRIGLMSCNPAIGGSAKSQLVRELDALGGEMAKAADAAGIQFRRLNASRGPAVHATRVLCDRKIYAEEMGRRVRGQACLELIEGSAEALEAAGGRVTGVRLDDGRYIRAGAIVLTTGTFLSGVLHTGERSCAGGRVGDAPARGLSDSLRRLGLELGRFKTGTPARLIASSIDYARTTLQPGDRPPRALSFWTAPNPFPALPQRACHLTHTTAATHALVRANLDRSPLHQGRIVGRGPRYCPSLEDKVERFAQREHHAVFLEPEGVDSPLVYPAGLSTSLPEEVQLAVLRTIPGLEAVEIAQPGYAVEYDYLPATQLQPTLVVRGLDGLYLAGQINGTSGYEEAAVQGFWAGVNAARAVRGQAPWLLGRERAHLAVLVDELVRKRADEPFRMFTSRSENRLDLREGNADLRLAEEGFALGLLTEGQRGQVAARRARIEVEVDRLRTERVNPDRATLGRLEEVGFGAIDRPTPLQELLCRPETSYARLCGLWPGERALCEADGEEVEAELRYAGYRARLEGERRRVAGQAGWLIPENFPFASLSGLSVEVREKLALARPATLAEAAGISGVTSAALGVLSIHLTRHYIR